MAAGTQVGAIYIDLDADTAKFKSAIGDAEKKAKDFGKNSSSYFQESADASKKFALAITALGAGITAFGVKAVKSFKDSQLVYKKLETLILNGKNGTMEQVKALNEQAKAEQRLGIYTDDLVTSAQAQLATFDLSADAVHDLIPSFLDMVAAEKGAGATTEDLKNSAQGLGKALLGQTDSLIKQGFVITKHQKKLLETGDEMTRVHTIAEILGNTYDGMNAKLRATLGPMELLKINLDDFTKSAGEAIDKAITPIIKSLNKWFDSMGGPDGLLKIINEKLKWIQNHGPLVAGIIAGALAPSFVDLAKDIGMAVIKLGPWIAGAIAVAYITDAVVKANGGWAKTMKDLQPVLADVGRIVGNLWVNIKQIATTAYEFLLPALKHLKKTFDEQLSPALKEFWQNHGQEMLRGLKMLGEFIGGTLVVILYGLIKVLEALIWVGSKFVKAYDKYVTDLRNKTDKGVKAITDFTQGTVKFVGEDVPNAFEQANDKVDDVSTTIGDNVVNLGKGIAKVFSQDIPNAIDQADKKMEALKRNWPEYIGTGLGVAAGQLYLFFSGDEKSTFGKWVDDFTNYWQKAWDGLIKTTVDGVDVIAGYLSGMSKDTKTKTESTNNEVQQNHVSTWQKIKQTVSDGVDQVADYLSGGSIKNAAKGTWDAVWKGAVTVSNNINSTIGNLADSIVRFFDSIPGRLESFFHNLLDQFAQYANRIGNTMKKKFLETIGVNTSKINFSYAGGKVYDAPARADGGPVSAGMPYWVGERRQPELFVPKQSGTIVPLEKATGNMNVVNNVSLNTPAAVEAWEQIQNKKALAAKFGVGIA